ncbi:uncharacterized protein [Watersipora subatra]|uniref:uncharacterized protein n=1 Tax=Watersipora subatra TaxID=2589382 RepID=UPI00355C7649
MLANRARRLVSSCLATSHRFSQLGNTRTASGNFAMLQKPLGSRLLSDKQSERLSDEVSELLDQMSQAAGDVSLEDYPYKEDSTLVDDEGLEDGSTLPGHRIKGILVPSAETLTTLVGGQIYERLPIAHVHASYNNTIIVITDYTGSTFISRSSCGTEGFKNAKQKTPVAAHTAALAAGKKAASQGVTHVRVRLKGRGQGRLASCKGFEEAGLNIVSLSDATPINWLTYFPRKRRRT